MLAGYRRALGLTLRGFALRGRAVGPGPGVGSGLGLRAVSTSWSPVGAAFDAKQQRGSAPGRETVSGGQGEDGLAPAVGRGSWPACCGVFQPVKVLWNTYLCSVGWKSGL